ncbi:hypothetical protein ACFY05_32575 [Microtetraspora fusca]|uniref:Uncharacterized protein n=1 Tax=Microtetraspora fusca TaxID=1997 RepID=A0ABW6VE36_MICFU
MASLSEVIDTHIRPAAEKAGYTRISTHDTLSFLYPRQRGRVVIIYRHGEDADVYSIVAWQHVHGRHTVALAATSNRRFLREGEGLRADQLADAFTAVAWQAENAPMSRRESAELTETPWYVRAFRYLTPRERP